MKLLCVLAALCLVLPAALATTPVNPGDVNSDNSVNMLDINIVASQLGLSPVTDTRADVNNDNAVNIYDFIQVTRNWGRTYAPPTWQTGYQARSVYVPSLGATYNYQVFIPQNYNPALSSPAILFIHGSGERGNNNVQQLSVGLGPTVTAQAATFPAIVVFPQIPNNQYAEGDPRNINGAGMDALALATLANTRAEFAIDSKRIYLTGVSMGAFRDWTIAYNNPSMFAAVAPISGGLVPPDFGFANTPIDAVQAQSAALVAARLRNEPIWQWHGDADGNVPIATYAYPIRDAFNALGPPATYHFVVGVGYGHQLEVNYNDPTFWTWLWAQHLP